MLSQTLMLFIELSTRSGQFSCLQDEAFKKTTNTYLFSLALKAHFDISPCDVQS